MTYTEKQLEEIENLSGLNYTFKQIAMYLNVSLVGMIDDYNDPQSEFRFHYDRGQLMASAQIDQSNLESAKTGNISAQQRYDKRQRENMLRKAKARIFGRAE